MLLFLRGEQKLFILVRRKKLAPVPVLKYSITVKFLLYFYTEERDFKNAVQIRGYTSGW